jgi:hypothetical protein
VTRAGVSERSVEGMMDAGMAAMKPHWAGWRIDLWDSRGLVAIAFAAESTR